MRKYNYRAVSGDLTFLDTLEVYNFNDSAKFILENFLAGKTLVSTAQALSEAYSVDSAHAIRDCESLFQQLQSIGLEPKVSTLSRSSEPKLTNEWTPRNAIVHIIQNCNSPCIMCDCWKTKDDVHLSRENLKKFFQKFSEFGGSEIMISGGEPLLHPDIEGILDDIASFKLERLLNTNALLLQKKEWLVDKGIEQLVVSLDGVDAQSYKFYRGVNAFHHVLKSMESFKKKSSKTQIGARLTLNRSNFNKLPLLFKTAFSAGVDTIGFSPADTSSTSFARSDMDAAKNLFLNDALLPGTSEIASFLNYFTPEHEDYKYIDSIFAAGRSQWDSAAIINCLKYYERMRSHQREIFDSEPCFFPRLSLLVDYDGSVRSCFYSKNFGNINKIEDVKWALEPRLEELRQSNACSTCRGRIFCDKVMA